MCNGDSGGPLLDSNGHVTGIGKHENVTGDWTDSKHELRRTSGPTTVSALVH